MASGGLGLEIIISHYEFISLYVACEAAKGKDKQKIKKQAEKVDELCRFISKEHYTLNPSIGQIVGVYLEDEPGFSPARKGQWVRGRVEHCLCRVNNTEYTLFLIDRGYKVQSKLRHMVTLNERITKDPPLSMWIGLYGVIPDVILNQKATLFVGDFCHRGLLYFKKQKKLGNIMFGDILLVQESDRKIISLTEYLIANKMVKRTEDFEKEATKFYGSRLGCNEDLEDSMEISIKEEENEMSASISSVKSKKTSPRSKDTGYSSLDAFDSDEYSSSEKPFRRDDEICLPAGYNFPGKKSSRNKEMPKMPKTYYQIMKERKNFSDPREKRQKEKSSSNIVQSRLCSREKPVGNTQKIHSMTLNLKQEEEMASDHHSVFRPKKVSFFDSGAQEQRKSLPVERQKVKTRAFDTGYKSKKAENIENIPPKYELEHKINEKPACGNDMKMEEVGQSRENEKEMLGTPRSLCNNMDTNLNTFFTTSTPRSLCNNTDTNLNTSFTTSTPLDSNSILCDNISCRASSPTKKSHLSKKEIIRDKLKAGLAVKEFIKDSEERNAEEPATIKLTDIDQGAFQPTAETISGKPSPCVSKKVLLSIKLKAELRAQNIEKGISAQYPAIRRHQSEEVGPNLSDFSESEISNSDISNTTPKESLNQNLAFNTAQCNLANEKRRLIREKWKKKRQEEILTDSETTDTASFCNQSVCSDDFSFPKQEKPTIMAMMSAPVGELDETNDDMEMDSSNTPEVLRSINIAAGVLVHTKDDRMIRPAITLTECCLEKNIIEKLELKGRREMNRIQKYSFPAITAGRNVTMICPRNSSGYVVPLTSHLLDRDYYLKLPPGNGPRVLVITPCWKAGLDIATEFRELTKLVHVIQTYGGGAELELKLDLLQGCDVLVSTPKCLLRLLGYGFTNLRRLCHLVMDDADILFDKFKPEMERLIQEVDSIDAAREEIELQVVLASCRWTDPIKEMVTWVLTNPTICISSQLEACVYSGIKPTAVFVDSNKKIEKLVGILKEVEGKRRTVVMCRSKDDVKTVHRLLIELGLKNVIAAHEDLSSIGLSEVPGFWYNQDIAEKIWNESTSLPIMVRSDEVLEEVPVTNADLLIHYNMSTSKKTFSLRFISLMENYQNVLKNETSIQKPQVIILLDEKNELEMPGVMEFMERLGTVLPDPVRQTLQKIEELKEHKKVMEPLCEDLKEFGQCWDVKSCRNRHVLIKDLDAPQNIPRTGWVKLMVQYIHDACHYSVRLLEHAEKEDEWARLSSDFTVLPIKLNNYYSIEGHKKLHGYPSVGDMVAVETSKDVYQRALVLKIVEYDKHNKPIKASVRLVDNGRYNNYMGVYQMYYLPDEFKERPHGVVDIYLCGLRPRDLDTSWPLASRNWIQQQLAEARRDSPNGYLMGKIVLAMDNSLWLEPVEYVEYLPTVDTTIFRLNLRKDLLQTNNAIQNNDHIHALCRLCEQAGIDIPPGKKIVQTKLVQPQPQWAWLPQDRCEIVHVIVIQNPDTIFLRLNYFSDSLQKLVEEIQRYGNNYNKKNTDNNKLLEVGDICLGKPSGSEDWNRAVIKNKPSEDEVELFFADYGDTDVVPWGNVIPISNQHILKLPFQVIECNLAGIEFLHSETEDWEDEVIDAIYNLTRTAEEEEALSLVVKVFGVEPEAKYTCGRRYKVVLLNRNVDPTVIINKDLLSSPFVQLTEEGKQLLKSFETSQAIDGLRENDGGNSEFDVEITASSSRLESAPPPPSNEVVLYDENYVNEDISGNEAKFLKFLDDFDKGDFDCSIFHGIEVNDADVSDNTSEGSGLSLPLSREALPREVGLPKRLPLPETEESSSSSDIVPSSSQHSSETEIENAVASIKTENCEVINKEYLDELQSHEAEVCTSPQHDADLTGFGQTVSSVSVPNNFHVPLQVSVSHSSSYASPTSPTNTSKVTGVANNFKDLISPTIINSFAFTSSSTTLGLMEKMSPFIKPNLHCKSVKDIHDGDLDNPGNMSERFNGSNISPSKEQGSSQTLEKSPVQKWVEGIPQSDSEEDQSILLQRSLLDEQTNCESILDPRKPAVEWHQNEKFIFVHIKLPGITEYKFNSGLSSFDFSAVYEGVHYNVSLELFGGVKLDTAKCAARACYVEIKLEKFLKGKLSKWPRLIKNKDEKLHWLKLNTEKSCAELEESEDEDVKRYVCSLPLWNENPVDSDTVNSSDRSEIADSDLSSL